jgi:glycosyltransferase involved in cell wall biosynthesis
MSFGITSATYLLGCRRPAVIYANSWPVFAASMIAVVARIRKIPLVTSVQDMYPESLYAQGRMSDTNPVARAIRRIDRWVGRNSALLFVAARNFQSAYIEDRGIDAGKIKVVLNWGDAERIKIDPEASADFRRAKGIPSEATLAVYGGNAGVASGLETLVKAFALLRDCTDAYLLIAGEGNNLDRCRQMAEANGHGRVLFHSPWPNKETALVLGAADMLLLPTRGNQSLASVPSKLISYLFAGRPVLAMAQAEAEIRNMIEAAQCGWVIAPDQPEQAAAALRKIFASDKPTLRRMGESGRLFALKHMSREHSVPYVLNLLAQLAGPAGQANHAEAACVPGSGPAHASKVD